MKRRSVFSAGRLLATALILALSGVATSVDAKKPTRPPPPQEPPQCDVSQPNYVVFLDGYPNGSFQLATLPCLSEDPVEFISPRELALDLPRRERRKFQVANGDVINDQGVRRIVFGGRTSSNDYWGIYEGVIDVARSMITQIKPAVTTPDVREEDPRFSSDGVWIVYKRNGEIWRTYADDPATSPTRFSREENCELWAPSMYANVVSYIRRCGSDANSDRVVYHVETNGPIILPSAGGGPDRFSHFTSSGQLVYSHVDSSNNTASLWMYGGPLDTPFPFYSATTSDDDAYAERNGSEYIAFSGWGSGGYDLYVYRSTGTSAVRLTSGINVLGSVFFD